MSLRLLTCGSVLVLMMSAGPGFPIRAGNQTQPVPPTVAEGYPLLSDAAFSRIFDQISNWGRWGKEDVKGTYNLLTPEKRKQAVALVRSGISVSLEHTLIETKGPDVTNPLQKLNRGNKLIWNSVHGGTYHSHIDALCHYAYKGVLYNGFARAEVETEQGCMPMGIDMYKDGFVTRGVLIDIPRLKGVAWLEPGTPVTLRDIEAWEQKTGITVLPGDAVFLRTGKWAKRATDGPWLIDRPGSTAIEWGPDAGWHWSVIPSWAQGSRRGHRCSRWSQRRAPRVRGTLHRAVLANSYGRARGNGRHHSRRSGSRGRRQSGSGVEPLGVHDDSRAAANRGGRGFTHQRHRDVLMAVAEFREN